MKIREEEMMRQNENRAMEELKKELAKTKTPEGVRPSAIREKIAAAMENAAEDTPRTYADGEEGSREERRGNRKKVPFYKNKKWVAVLCSLAVVAVSVGAFGIGQAVNAPKNIEMTAHSTHSGSGGGAGTIAEEATKAPAATEGVGDAVQIACAGSYEELFQMFRDLDVTDPEYNLSPLGIGRENYAMEESVDAGGSTGAGMDQAEITGAPQTSVADMENTGAMAVEGSVSTTNIQEEGVDEADVIKTDGTFIYILQENENALRVVRADRGQMTECDNCLLGDSDGSLSVTPREFYVSDGILTVILQNREIRYYDRSYQPISKEEADALLSERETLNKVGSTPCCYANEKTYVTAKSFSVGEDGVLSDLGTLTQDGSYQSSRKVGGVLYLFTTCYTSVIHEDGSVAEEYVPTINGACIPADSIAMPDNPTNGYIVGSAFACEAPETLIDQFSVLDSNFFSDVYMSQNAIYFAEAGYEENAAFPHEYTQILKYAYQDGTMTPCGTVNVKGQVHNSFSMDEHNGFLRLVTTENVEKVQYVKYGKPDENGYQDVEKTADQWFDGSVREAVWELENHLFVLDETLRQVGSIEHIAPGEQIRSARFMGDTGYFVTYENTDPLFSVDLSDPADPRIMGALKIPGFSSYLHFYSDGLLLGLGQETDEETGKFISLKLSMFDISDPFDVRETDKYLLNNVRRADFAEAMTDHKALLIAPSRNIIGFSASADSVWDEGTMTTSYDNCYSVYGYGDGGFYEQFAFEQRCSAMRGLFIGDVLYVCAWKEAEGETLTAFDMSNGYAQIGELELPKQFTRPEPGIIEDFVYYE